MFSMEGFFDLHVHSGPDIFERTGDDMDFAYLGREAGMAGMALKSALGSTAERAYLVNKVVDGFRMVGGVVLNYTVGGINPTAVDTCLKLGGRVIWGPSGHSAFHARLKGTLGNWGKKGMTLYNPKGAQGISVFNERGELSEDILEVLSLIKASNAVFCTSHLSPEESLALAKYCGREHIKIVYTHLGWTPEYSLEVGRAFVNYGGMIELTSVTFGSFDNKLRLEDAVQYIHGLGAKNIILATDAGNHRFVRPPESLRAFAVNLILAGVPEADIRHMASTNPLLLIEP